MYETNPEVITMQLVVIRAVAEDTATRGEGAADES
jgi:hypothetical protein